MVPFTKAFSRIRAERFAEMLASAPVGAEAVVVGENFRFGHGGAGTVDMLTQFGRSRGLHVESPPTITSPDGKPISSTRIRRLVATGQVAEVIPLLGPARTRWRGSSCPATSAAAPWASRPPTWRSPPTSPCRAAASTPAARCSSAGAAPRRSTSGWPRPSPPPTPRATLRIEAFLLDHDGSDLYGRTMRIEFLERLRDERRFESPEALVAQITQDIERTREVAARPVEGAPA